MGYVYPICMFVSNTWDLRVQNISCERLCVTACLIKDPHLPRDNCSQLKEIRCSDVRGRSPAAAAS